MSFSHFFVLLGAVWSLVNLFVGLVAGAVTLACGMDPASCSDLALETVTTWQRLLWWYIPLFAFGTYFGFKTVWPDLRRIFGEIRAARRRRRSGSASN